MSWLLRKGLWFGAVSAVLMASGATGGAVAARGAVTTTFATPGTYVWTVPTGVTNATFDVYGARGGSVLANVSGQVQLVSSGGAGGEAKGRFTVHGGEKFEIVVGGQGGTGTVNSSTGRSRCFSSPRLNPPQSNA